MNDFFHTLTTKFDPKNFTHRTDYETKKYLTQSANYSLRQLENMVNTLGVSYAQLHDEIEECPEIVKNVLKEQLFSISLVMINFYGTWPGVWIDARNEIAVNKCKDIANLDNFKRLYDNWNTEKNNDFDMKYYQIIASESNRMHRTLLQTALGFFIYILVTDGPNEYTEDIISAMKDKYGDKFWRMPLI